MICKVLQFFVFLVLFCNSVRCENKELTMGGNAIRDSITATNKTSTLGPSKSTNYKSARNKLLEQTRKLVCPDRDARKPLFSLPCKVDKECLQLGNKNMLCCNNRCWKGTPAPPPEPVHSSTLFGLVERVCPKDRIPEILDIKECTTDDDCSPRICCPEKMRNGEVVAFCRTAEPKLDNLPAAKQFMEPFRFVMGYMQCTPPPPPALDLFPTECTNPLDCFPNLCCQERGKRFCRPPKRSLLTLITTIAQRIVPSETARELILKIAS